MKFYKSKICPIARIGKPNHVKAMNELKDFLVWSLLRISILWNKVLTKARGRQIKLQTKKVTTAMKATGKCKTFKAYLFTQRFSLIFEISRIKGKKSKTKQFNGGGAEMRQL